jgi:hypothetical protein
MDQRLLYDPTYKYDVGNAPARRVSGDLFSAHLQHTTNKLTADLRAGYFSRAFIRGTLTQQPAYRFGAFTGTTFHFVGEDLAERQDTVSARAPVQGFSVPDWSDRTPWGVPAFFRAGGSSGEIAWNRFREVRGQATSAWVGRTRDFYFGAELARQRVRTFQRAFAYLPVGDSVPPATASTFTPTSAAAYAEGQLRGRTSSSRSDCATTSSTREPASPTRRSARGARSIRASASRRC